MYMLVMSVYMHIYTYIYICLCVQVCIWRNMLDLGHFTVVSGWHTSVFINAYIEDG